MYTHGLLRGIERFCVAPVGQAYGCLLEVDARLNVDLIKDCYITNNNNGDDLHSG